MPPPNAVIARGHHHRSHFFPLSLSLSLTSNVLRIFCYLHFLAHISTPTHKLSHSPFHHPSIDPFPSTSQWPFLFCHFCLFVVPQLPPALAQLPIVLVCWMCSRLLVGLAIFAAVPPPFTHSIHPASQPASHLCAKICAVAVTNFWLVALVGNSPSIRRIFAFFHAKELKWEWKRKNGR